MKVVSLVGARPQFIKEALLGAAVRSAGAWQHVLVHSGQHYDAMMSDVFFEELGMPKPDYFLGVGSGSHAKQTAEALVRIEEVLASECPDLVIVYGDTNTTVAGALAAAKLRIPVAHVEAGIRQRPKDMPEEINRVMTDHISARLFCCSEGAATNLAREGIVDGVHVVGDVMYDLYRMMAPRFDPHGACDRFGLEDRNFVLCTLHRDFNVDDEISLSGILKGMCGIREKTGCEIVFPIHPRTRKRVSEFGLDDIAAPLRLCSPLGYLDLQSLARACRFAVTDSGGFQKETYFAGKRAVVVMPDTGWRELVETGWNVLTEPTEQGLIQALGALRSDATLPKNVYGDGHAAEKIIPVVLTGGK